MPTNELKSRAKVITRNIMRSCGVEDWLSSRTETLAAKDSEGRFVRVRGGGEEVVRVCNHLLSDYFSPYSVLLNLYI